MPVYENLIPLNDCLKNLLPVYQKKMDSTKRGPGVLPDSNNNF